MKEVNLEYVLHPDNRSFTTAQDLALPTFFGANADSSDDYREEIHKMATRLATMFSTMKEFPSIRFRAALPPGDEYPPGLESRLLVGQRLAVELYETLAEMQRLGQIPERETCELIITDRGFDPVAPVIHEFTYEAMAHDLLEGTPSLKGKIFTYNSESQGGKKEPKEHVLDERDDLHVELRHRHFAAASLRISSAMDDLRAQSRLAGRGSSVGQLDLKGMSKLVQALPQYRDQLSNLSAHVELASSLNRGVEARRLTELGKLEQDLVYGDATSKEVIAFLSANQMLPEQERVRVLMCYSATHQEKLDPTRASQWQKVARLSSANMSAITNLEYLGIPVCKRQRGALASLSFGRKRRKAVRKDREMGEDESQYSLSRFVPVLAEVLDNAASGRLSQEEYPYVRPPGSPSGASGSGFGFQQQQQQQPYSSHQSGGGGGASADYSGGESDGTPRGGTAGGVASFRTLRSTGNWAKKASSGGSGAVVPGESRGGAMVGGGGDGAGGGLGTRMIAFVIGGFTFSELRVAHRMTARTGRDVLLGGTSVQTPVNFIQQVVSLGEGGMAQQGAAFEIEQPGAGVSVRKR
jgi:syntaxin-binding protein 1